MNSFSVLVAGQLQKKYHPPEKYNVKHEIPARIGLTSDGKVVIRGENRYCQRNHGQCDCEGLHLFQDVMTINQERREILQAEQRKLQSELSSMHGLFSIMRRKKIETRLVELGEALKQNSADEKEKQYDCN